ncbi:MAG: rhodanese-like domain-containing protein [Desulfobacterales bacterium]
MPQIMAFIGCFQTGCFAPGSTDTPHRLRHCRAFVFPRRRRKDASHPLCGWSVIQPVVIKRYISPIWHSVCCTIIEYNTHQGEIARTDLLIPFNKIDRYEDQLPDDKDAKMVVYCMMGPMGRIAAEKLVSMGYSQVIHLQGGMMAWQKVGKKLLIRSD